MKKPILSIIGNLTIGILFSFIGFVNTFWGNDPFYGLAIILMSLIFYLPFVNSVLEKTPEKLQLVLKMLIGFLIVWSSLGVGELFDKIDLMQLNYPIPNYESVGNN